MSENRTIFGFFLAVCIILFTFTCVRDAEANVQAHSMLHTCCTTPERIDATFHAAQEMGATRIRLDVEVHGIVGVYGNDYSKLDAVLDASRRYHIKVLGILSGTPLAMSDCPDQPLEVMWKCAAKDPEVYGRAVGQIIQHAPQVTWEFWNEPDLDYMYTGTPEQYGQMLRSIYRHKGDARISIGGMAGRKSFVRRAIAAGARFDIANVHIRGRLTTLRRTTIRWRRFFYRETGRKLPLWVTEHGFPSDPRYQWGGFQGETGQAQYLTRSVAALRRGGARQIFVTLFDSTEFGDSLYASEGVAGKTASRVLN